MRLLARSLENRGLSRGKLGPDQGDLVQERPADGLALLVAARAMAPDVGPFACVPLAVELLAHLLPSTTLPALAAPLILGPVLVIAVLGPARHVASFES